jgi:hypothetical protein
LYTNASIDKLIKVLLINQHRSHIDLDFVIKATLANIHLYPFFSYFTYVLQLLNVRVFQLYKHWHTKVVQHAMRNLDLDYNIAPFMQDLLEIRAETFKKGIIHSAFQKSGFGQLTAK